MATPLNVNSSAALERALRVLDHTPVQQTLKVALLYVAPGQTCESDILSNVSGSALYVKFLKQIGEYVALDACAAKHEYTGGLDCITGCDGQYAIRWEDEVNTIIFHVATMIGEIDEHATDEMLEEAVLTKKRHVGNDWIHVVFSEASNYDMSTIACEFNYVTIIIFPLDQDGDFYRVEVKAKQGIYFGPVVPASSKVVSKKSLAGFVRVTIIHATIAAESCQQEEHKVSNCEERLRQIIRIRERFGGVETDLTTC